MIMHSIPEAFESRIRIAIVTALLVEPKTFKELIRITEATEGNLSSHLTKLEKMEYIESKKEFVGKKTQTTYTLTQIGKQSFHDYVSLLESILKDSKNQE